MTVAAARDRGISPDEFREWACSHIPWADPETTDSEIWNWMTEARLGVVSCRDVFACEGRRHR